MDAKKFYGSLRYVREIPDNEESECSDFSEDDDETVFDAGKVNISSDSEFEEGDSYIVEDDNNDVPIQGVASLRRDLSSSDEDDNMPLVDLAEKLYPGTWRKGSLNRNAEQIIFKGNGQMPNEVCDLQSPVDFFYFLFPKEIINHITEQSNLYAAQNGIGKAANTSAQEIQQFIGILLYMSIVQLPASRHYWSNALGYTSVSNIMSCNKWEEIKRSLHFNNNELFIPRGQPGHDNLFKIKPIVEKLREQLVKVPREEHVAVDEQIIPTKANCSLKQYNPRKPHKWGYKNFVLSGISGFSYDFEIFAGAQSNTIPAGAPDLGASGNVVTRLAATIPRNVNHKIFFDNWFSSVPLMTYLDSIGILPLGTVRPNRIPGCILPTERELKVRGRGSMDEKVAIKDSIKISTVTWYDNKVVTTMSTYVGSEPKGEIQRYFRSTKEHKMIPCPQSILTYNNYMGGVDLLDSMLGYYRIKVRSKKWYMKIFFHLLDMCTVNAWLLWRRQNPGQYSPLMDFKMSIAEALCNAGTPAMTRRGRPPKTVQEQYEKKRKAGPTSKIPQKQVREDGLHHYPEHKTNRQRCKFPGCQYKSNISCIKCGVALCLNKDRNCFLKFHVE